MHVRRRLIIAIELVAAAFVLGVVGWRSASTNSGIGISLLAAAALLVVVAFVQSMIMLRRSIVRKSHKKNIGEGACRRCGYALRGLRIKRCPECGALLGFTKSAEELGIKKDELLEHK